MSQIPVAVNQVQGIRARKRPKGHCAPNTNRRLKGINPGVERYSHFGPTTLSVGLEYRTCVPPTEILGACNPAEPQNPSVVPVPPAATETVPWQQPGYRGVQFPKTVIAAISTFGATNVRTVWVQRALAGYNTTTNFPVTAIALTAGATPQPSIVLSFQAPDNYVGNELFVSCQDQRLLYACQWTATVQGVVKAGPFSIISGSAQLNLQAKKDETIAISIIPALNDVFAVGIEVLLTGWYYPLA